MQTRAVQCCHDNCTLHNTRGTFRLGCNMLNVSFRYRTTLTSELTSGHMADLVRLAEEIEAPYAFAGLSHLAAVSCATATPVRLLMAGSWVDPVDLFESPVKEQYLAAMSNRVPLLIAATIVRRWFDGKEQYATQGVRFHFLSAFAFCRWCPPSHDRGRPYFYILLEDKPPNMISCISTVYNVTCQSPSAHDIEQLASNSLPHARRTVMSLEDAMKVGLLYATIYTVAQWICRQTASFTSSTITCPSSGSEGRARRCRRTMCLLVHAVCLRAFPQ